MAPAGQTLKKTKSGRLAGLYVAYFWITYSDGRTGPTSGMVIEVSAN